MIHSFRIILLLLTMALSTTLFAADAEAGELMKKANLKFKEKSFSDAASIALDAEHMADSVELKAAAVKLAVAGYRNAGQLYREFENVDKLLTNYSGKVDFPALVDREFEIADKFYSGHRDPAYYALRWIPWLYDDDRTIEAYEKAIAHAPYAKQAPEAKLRVAIKVLETGKDYNRALELLRSIVKDYPDTPQAKSAMLHLGVALANLAKYGDGDGTFNREAIQVLNEYKLKYPESREVKYVDTLILNTRDIQAERLLKVADFYKKNGRAEVGERYLAEVVRQYPDSTSADVAERRLAEADTTYIPQPLRPAMEPRIDSYSAHPIPQSGGKLLIAPQNSDNKYLLPIRDLGLNKNEEKTNE